MSYIKLPLNSQKYEVIKGDNGSITLNIVDAVKSPAIVQSQDDKKSPDNSFRKKPI